MTRKISHSEWTARYGVPELHDALKNDCASRYRIREMTNAEARYVGDMPGLRFFKLIRGQQFLVGVADAEIVQWINCATDETLAELWRVMVQGGVKVHES